MKIRQVGVVMACVNCLTYSKQTFDSVVAPPGVKLRWLVIDNGSVDYSYGYFSDRNTPAIPVEVVRHDHNIGVSRAWNEGIRWAWQRECDAVLITGNDIVFHPDAIANLCRWIEGGEAFVTVAPVGVHPGVLPEIRLEHTWLPYPAFVAFMLTPEVTARGLWFDESLVVPEYWNDNFFSEALVAAGLPAGHVLDAVVTHYGSRSIHEGGVSVGDAYEANRRQFVARYGYDPSRLQPRPAHLPPLLPHRQREVAALPAVPWWRRWLEQCRDVWRVLGDGVVRLDDWLCCR
jgi:GT2 family glycosyltransferase